MYAELSSLGFFEECNDALPAELIPALEESDLEDEEVADEVATQLID